MAQDQLIKSGQLTLARILFLVIAGAVIVGMVALGGVWLTVGYWLLTLSLVVPLFMILRDDHVSLDASNAPAADYQAIPETAAAEAPAEGARVRRRGARPARRRR